MTGTRRPAAAHLHGAGSQGGLHRAVELAHRPQLPIPPTLLRQASRAGPLESPRVAAGLLVLLAASIVVAVRRHQRRAGPSRRLRWPGRVGLAAWLAALTTLTGLAGLNAYVGYIPTLPALLGQIPSTVGRTGSQVLRRVVGAPQPGRTPQSGLHLPPARLRQPGQRQPPLPGRLPAAWSPRRPA
jgi:hypothetical protein